VSACRWILDIITGLIDRPVKRAIQSAVEKVCSVRALVRRATLTLLAHFVWLHLQDVANAIVKLNSELQAANTLVPLGLLDFNIGLPSAPIFTSSYLSLPVFGTRANHSPIRRSSQASKQERERER